MTTKSDSGKHIAAYAKGQFSIKNPYPLFEYLEADDEQPLKLLNVALLKLVSQHWGIGVIIDRKNIDYSVRCIVCCSSFESRAKFLYKRREGWLGSG